MELVRSAVGGSLFQRKILAPKVREKKQRKKNEVFSEKHVDDSGTSSLLLSFGAV